MYYFHEVEFECWMKYGMNDFCAHGFTLNNVDNDQMAVFCKTLIVYQFCHT